MALYLGDGGLLLPFLQRNSPPKIKFYFPLYSFTIIVILSVKANGNRNYHVILFYEISALYI